MKRALSRLYQSAWGRVLLAGVLTALALLAFSQVQQITYLTNDDNAIAFTLAGYHTGAPSPYALFINCILGYAVSGLYTALPGVAWWAVLQMAAIYASCAAIGAVLLREGARHEQPMLLPLALYAAFLLLFGLQPFVELTYTVTAALLGAAGAALVLTAAGEARASKRVLLDTLGAVAVVLAFLYREETGYAALCFFAASCAFRAINAFLCGGERKRRALVRVLILFGAVMLLCFGALLFNKSMHTRVNGEAYETFFRYRERFTDYPRLSYAENPALYASVGWDEPLYDLADYWCFLDARINADTLKTITDAKMQGPSLIETVKAGVTVIDEDVSLRLSAAFLLLVFTGALYAKFKARSRRDGAFLILCAVLLGTALLCGFLCLRGRFLARTFRVAAIPAAALMSVLLLRLAPPYAQKRDKAASALFAGMAVVLALASGLYTAKELRVNSPKYLLRDSSAVMAYVLAHPENIYVRDTAVVSDIDAFTVYPENKPVNLLSWGGCEMRSAEAEKQLIVNGVAARDAELFRQENVYAILRADSTEEAVLLAYLKSARGATGLTRTDDITDEIGVYRVTY